MTEQPQTIYLEPKETYDSCILKIDDGIVYYCVDSILNILTDDFESWIKENPVYLEEQDANSGSKFFLYRNRTTLFFPHLSRKLPINFYLSDEFFCHQGKGLNQNRVLVGLLIPLNQRMSGDLFFQKRFLKREGQWFSQNILGTYLNFFY